MLMQIGQKPEHDFSEPIGMLEDCHKRILHFMQTLVTLAESVGAAPLNADDRDALKHSLGYFRESAPRHNSDEEESLFPKLRSHPEAQKDNIFARLDLLAADHRWAETQHLGIDAIGSRWLSTGVLLSSDHARLRATVHPLLRFYAHHIDIEEREVFPAAQRILSAAEKDTIGGEMAWRRGFMWPRRPNVVP